MHMHICLGGVAIMCDYPHPAWGGLFEMENSLLFYELFFVNLYHFRKHCFQFSLTEDLNVVQSVI